MTGTTEFRAMQKKSKSDGKNIDFFVEKLATFLQVIFYEKI